MLPSANFKMTLDHAPSDNEFTTHLNQLKNKFDTQDETNAKGNLPVG